MSDGSEHVGEPAADVPTHDPTDSACMGKKTSREDGDVLFAGYCRAHPGKGTDHVGEGRCKLHGGASTGAPKNNGNAETHGMRADGRKWFERHREDAAEDVQLMVEAWMADAPFDWDNYGNVQLLVDAAINECQIRRGDEYIREEGHIVEDFDGIAKDGREIYERKENPAFMAKSRLQRDTVRILDKLGILESDDDDTTVNVNVHEEILDGMKAAHGDE